MPKGVDTGDHPGRKVDWSSHMARTGGHTTDIHDTQFSGGSMQGWKSDPDEAQEPYSSDFAAKLRNSYIDKGGGAYQAEQWSDRHEDERNRKGGY